MATAARRTTQEYWRPANPHVVELIESSAKREACRRCGVDYAPAARFCQACGSPRGFMAESGDAQGLTYTASTGHRRVSIGALVLFVLGVLCIAAAALVGAIFKADTMSTWEAIQAWRVEWLLAAAAAFLAGILLKKVD